MIYVFDAWFVGAPARRFASFLDWRVVDLPGSVRQKFKNPVKVVFDDGLCKIFIENSYR